MEASSKVKDFSSQAVKRVVLREGLTHWLSLYPAALGAPLGLAAFLFDMPLLYFGMIGTLTVSLASVIINIFFRHDAIANRYLERLSEKLHEDEKKTLANLENELRQASQIKYGGPLAGQGKEQFRRLQVKYENVHTVLRKKLSSGELAFGRFEGASEQVYLNGLENLKQIVTILQSLESIDPEYIGLRLSQLNTINKLTTADQKERETLLKRLQLRKDQLEKVNQLLTSNEEAMTTLEETTAAIASMDTSGKLTEMEYDTAIEQLQEIVARAHIYNKH